MGKGPDEIAREIRDLRRETGVIIGELERRANPGNVARGVASSVTHGAEDVADTVVHRAEEVADDVLQVMPEPVRRYPTVLGGAALGVLVSAGAFAVSRVLHERRPSPAELASMRVQASLSRVGDRFQTALRQAQAASSAQLATQRGEASMFKRLLWVALVSVMGALGAMLFQRLSADLWRSTMHENPPKK